MRIDDKMLIALVALLDGFVERDDESNATTIQLRKKEERVDIIIEDFVSILSTLHIEIGGGQLECILATRCDEISLFLAELRDYVARDRLDDACIQDTLVEELRMGCLGLVRNSGEMEGDLHQGVFFPFCLVGQGELDLQLVSVVRGDNTQGGII